MSSFEVLEQSRAFSERSVSAIKNEGIRILSLICLTGILSI